MTKQDRDDYFKEYMKGKATRKALINKQNPEQKIISKIYHKIMNGSSFEDNRGDHK